MNIISERENVNRMIDGINTILAMPQDEFEQLIEEMTPHNGGINSLNFFYLTDNCEGPENPQKVGLERIYDDEGKMISRAYFGGERFKTSQILQECQKCMLVYRDDSQEYDRLSRLLHSRDLDAFKNVFIKDDRSALLVENVFKILLDDNTLTEFLDYDHHKNTFSVMGQEVPISDYFKILGNIFGNVDKDKNVSFENRINDFFLPNLAKMKNSYLSIFDAMNIDRYVNPRFTFEVLPHITDKVVRVGEEAAWNLSPEIQEQVLGDMPTDLSSEEQALYVYCKMCTTFTYDEGYLYRDKLKKLNYESDFSKEHLESLKPGDKITCYDFSRIFVKLASELGEGVTPVMILTGMNEGHAFAGFYTENVSATMEAVNTLSNSDATNDLMKAQNGIMLSGIQIISDKNGLVEPALEKVYHSIFGGRAKTIKEYVQQLKNTQQEADIPNDVQLKIESFLEVMRSKNIRGNEFTQTLWGMRKTNYFGDEPLEMAYLGELVQGERKGKHFKRHILLRQSNENHQGENVFMIDTDSLDFSISSREEIIEKLKSGELIYEDAKHKLPGIDKEESR